MLNKKEKSILILSFAVIVLGGITCVNKNKLADNVSSSHILNTIYKKNNHKKIKNEIYRKISDKDFRKIINDLSFEKLEVTNDILKETALVSALNSNDKKDFLKNLTSENQSYDKAQSTYKILNGFNALETISPEFSSYIKNEFGYNKENFNMNIIKEIPNSIIQKDKLVKLTLNENLKNIIKNLSYDNINKFSSLVEKNPSLVKILEKPFNSEEKDRFNLKSLDEKYFAQELDFENMQDIYAVSRDIAALGNLDSSLKDFFRINLSDFDYNKIANYGGLYLSDRKNEIEINKEYTSYNYTFENPYIKLNPYNRTPLGALVNFNTEYKDNPIKVTIKGIDGNPDFSYVLNKVSEQGIPVVGLYPNTNNKVNIKILSKNKNSVIKEKILSIKTEILDERLPIVVIEKDYEDLFPGTLEPGMNTASFITEEKSLPFIFDNYGKIRYVFNCDENMGRVILKKDKNDSWILDNGKTVIKTDSLGKVSGDKIEVKEYKELKVDDDLTKGYTVNHIQYLPKKNNLLIVYGFSSTTYSSAVFSEVDRETREEYFKARIYFKKSGIEENNIIFGERTKISPKNI
ncbi:arylsulfate sulfotransferase N-terminal domain-containing protein [Fusobacterium perfoetens]|uniref:aryl-sulfate sulfotransferase N-terminal domain-containing protein n=1 Tax=Fusobacterium perfoetens TaxID=852 RepID=UPI001F42EAAA|nr:aryl-sulfate sulfotransferase N-terminal domain-containing protein [Fusobacterium perfoetens]MCF2624584.1 arylsulfate sulfotransferase N-terminal domain-containing protein [Fusobacterium perfoetens]